MRLLPAIRTGWRRSLRYWPLLFIFYLVNLFSAGLLALPPALGLLPLADRTAIQDAADGIDSWLLNEFGYSLYNTGEVQALNMPTPPSPDALTLTWLTFASVMMLPLVAWLPTAFILGGALLTYVEAPARFSWRRFWWGCWHWSASFLVWGGLKGLVVLGIGMPLLAAAVFLANLAPFVAVIVTVLALLVWTTWQALTELTQLFMVQQSRRNPLAGLGLAARFMWRQPKAWLGMYVLLILALVVVHGVFRLGLLPALPLAVWPLVFVVQQAFIGLRLWLQAWRFAGGAALAESWIPAAPETPGEQLHS